MIGEIQPGRREGGGQSAILFPFHPTRKKTGGGPSRARIWAKPRGAPVGGTGQSMKGVGVLAASLSPRPGGQGLVDSRPKTPGTGVGHRATGDFAFVLHQGSKFFFSFSSSFRPRPTAGQKVVCWLREGDSGGGTGGRGAGGAGSPRGDVVWEGGGRSQTGLFPGRRGGRGRRTKKRGTQSPGGGGRRQ